MLSTAASANTDIVVGITGASGAIYATRLLEVLLCAGRRVHLTISPAAVEVLKTELDVTLDLQKLDAAQLGVTTERTAGTARSSTITTKITPPRSRAARSLPREW